MKIYIMRGLPGCGKSTWISKTKIAGDLICSADHIHMIDGIYKYDPVKAADGHRICLREYNRAVSGVDFPYTNCVFVDNTNTSIFEIAPYVQLAEAYQIPYEIIFFPCSIETSIQRNVHNVPVGTILEMNRRLNAESLPPWWKIRLP